VYHSELVTRCLIITLDAGFVCVRPCVGLIEPVYNMSDLNVVYIGTISPTSVSLLLTDDAAMCVLDVVYIGTINHTHVSLSLMMLAVCVLDVVYIGTINPTHVSLSLMMLAAGKHVVCEKPMSLTDAGAKKVLEFAQQKQLLYVEVTNSDFYSVIFF